MTKCNLITTKLLCKMIQMSSSHSCTQITWRLLNRKHRFKYIRFKYRNRDIQTFCIFFYNFPVRLTVTGIHNQKLYFKFKFVMQLQFLKAFRHQHGILTTRDTDSDLITRLHQLISIDSLCELRPDAFFEFLPQTQFYILCFILLLRFAHDIKQPCTITTFKTLCLISFFFQMLRYIDTDYASRTENNKQLVLIHLAACLYFFRRNHNRIRHCPMRDLNGIPDVDQLVTVFISIL